MPSAVWRTMIFLAEPPATLMVSSRVVRGLTVPSYRYPSPLSFSR